MQTRRVLSLSVLMLSAGLVRDAKIRRQPDNIPDQFRNLVINKGSADETAA